MYPFLLRGHYTERSLRCSLLLLNAQNGTPLLTVLHLLHIFRMAVLKRA